MILYLIKSTLLLAVLLGLYKLLLENEKMHRFNRFYLLMALVFGFTVPLVSIQISPEVHLAGLEAETLERVVQKPTQQISSNIERVLIPTTPLAQSVDESTQTATTSPFPTLAVLWAVYGSVLAVLFLRFVWGLKQIHGNIHKSERAPFKHSTLILMEDAITPQSFLNFIFVNKSDFQSGKIGPEILEHELTHVRQFHSLDVLFIELLKLVFWFNPLLYLYKHAIQLNHEFLADQYVVSTVSSIPDYQKKLIEVCESNISIPDQILRRSNP